METRAAVERHKEYIPQCFFQDIGGKTRKNSMELLEMKNVTSRMKNSQDELHSDLKTGENT